MNRRSYHMYIFRVDEQSLGISRDRFLEALNAEGVPVSAGWYRPLYGNGLFQNAHEGPVHGITSPLAGKGVDYRRVSCPVCEQVCRDAVWIPQNVLLADEPRILKLGEAIRKIVASAEELR
jgi:dTDP-4-amino-4,6-dideoxygalactose transaminase